MHYLAQILKKEGHTVAAFFIMPHEVLLNQQDYSQFVEANPDMDIFTVRDMALKYFHDVKASKMSIDWDYVNKIEKEYSNFKTIGLQTLSSQWFSTYAHSRNYYHDLPWDKQLYFMQLYYERVENILDEFKPDVIYDSDVAEYGRTVLLEVSYARGIPYVTLQHSYFQDYLLPTLTLSTTVEDWWINAYDTKKMELHSCADLSTRPGMKALQDFRKKRRILRKDQNFIYQVGIFAWRRDTHMLDYSIKKTIKWNLPYWWKYFRHVTTPLFSDPIWRNIYHIQEYMGKLLNRYFSLFERVNLEKEHYILFPLHQLPESSTLQKSPFYLNETILIEAVSKSALPNQRILVKENPVMIGERPRSFYRKIKRLPNVILVDPFMFDDPRPYIEHADGVITITGTAGMEAVLLGKPSIIFGPTPYSVLSCVQQLSDVTKLPQAIRSWRDYVTDDRELAVYIETVMEWGAKCGLLYLTGKPLQCNSTEILEQTEVLYSILKKGEETFHIEENRF